MKNLSVRHSTWCPTLQRVTLIERWLTILRDFLRTEVPSQIWKTLDRNGDVIWDGLINWHFIKIKHFSNSKPGLLCFSLDSYENRGLWMHSWFHTSIRNQFIKKLEITDSVLWQLCWKTKYQLVSMDVTNLWKRILFSLSSKAVKGFPYIFI